MLFDPSLNRTSNLRRDRGTCPRLNPAQRFQLLWFEEDLKSRLR
jgi:hypothetical protein